MYLQHHMAGKRKIETGNEKDRKCTFSIFCYQFCFKKMSKTWNKIIAKITLMFIKKTKMTKSEIKNNDNM